MSQRNSRAAKAARRAAPKLKARYPLMPPGTCYGSSTILAHCYPGLRYAEGIRVMTAWLPGGRKHVIRLEHAWNVDTGTGEIWDSTMAPEAHVLAMMSQVRLRYDEGASTQTPDSYRGWCEVAAEATQGMTWDAKRRYIEAVGLALKAVPAEDCEKAS